MIVIIRWWLLLEIHGIMWSYGMLDLGILDWRMNRLARKNLLGQFTKIDMPTCEYCLPAKTTRKPFEKGIRTKTSLQLISFLHLWSYEC